MAECLRIKTKRFIYIVDDFSVAGILLFVGWVLGILTSCYLV